MTEKKKDAASIADTSALMHKPVLTLTEVSKLLQLNEKTVIKMIVRGDLVGARKIERVWRIPMRSILNWFGIDSLM